MSATPTVRGLADTGKLRRGSRQALKSSVHTGEIPGPQMTRNITPRRVQFGTRQLRVEPPSPKCRASKAMQANHAHLPGPPPDRQQLTVVSLYGIRRQSHRHALMNRSKANKQARTTYSRCGHHVHVLPKRKVEVRDRRQNLQTRRPCVEGNRPKCSKSFWSRPDCLLPGQIKANAILFLPDFNTSEYLPLQGRCSRLRLHRRLRMCKEKSLSVVFQGRRPIQRKPPAGGRLSVGKQQLLLRLLTIEPRYRRR
ncbi:hypothetical protein LZ30DRAFT_248689 [Colletotrichum cereale]|nr:hypothetical protein LZ30DRAFT_248689 [Colletotrichum cereale]